MYQTKATRRLRRVRTGDVKTNDQATGKDEVDGDDVVDPRAFVWLRERGRVTTRRVDFRDSRVTIDVAEMRKFADEKR